MFGSALTSTAQIRSNFMPDTSSLLILTEQDARYVREALRWVAKQREKRGAGWCPTARQIASIPTDRLRFAEGPPSDSLTIWQRLRRYLYARLPRPELTRHQDLRNVALVLAAVCWVDTARQYYRAGWMPKDMDILKSRLYWRLRTGKPPLPEPPPRAFSCPWYEVIEELTPHRNQEMQLLKDGKGVYLNQCRYALLEKRDDGVMILGFGRWRFRAWSQEAQAPDQAVCWKYWIQRVPELEDGEDVGRGE